MLGGSVRRSPWPDISASTVRRRGANYGAQEALRLSGRGQLHIIGFPGARGAYRLRKAASSVSATETRSP
jgi:hypothetical protein